MQTDSTYRLPSATPSFVNVLGGDHDSVVSDSTESMEIQENHDVQKEAAKSEQKLLQAKKIMKDTNRQMRTLKQGFEKL